MESLISVSTAVLMLLTSLTGTYDPPADSVSNEERLPVTVRSDTSMINQLNRRANDLRKQGQLDSTRVLIERARHLSDSLDYTEGLARASANFGNILLSQGKTDSVILTMEEAWERFGETSRGLNIGNILATAYRYNGNYDKSLRLYQTIQERAQEEGDLEMELAVEQNLGVVYEYLGDNALALERYHTSLELAEARGDSTVMMVVLNNIGDLHTSQENYEQAEYYLKQSLELSRLLDSPSDISTAYVNLGILYRALERYEEAEQYYRRSLEISEELGDIIGPVRILFNLGNLYLDQGQYEKAREAFVNSLDLSIERNILQGKYYNNIGLGDLHQELDNLSEAIEHFSQAHKIALQIKAPNLKSTTLERLYQAHEQAGNLSLAFENLKEFNNLTDSLRDVENEENLARYQTLLDLRYEREQNQILEESIRAQSKTIWMGIFSLIIIFLIAVAFYRMYREKTEVNELLVENSNELEKANRKVADQRSRLEELNEMKDKLLSILAHDLRSPVSGLQSIVTLIREGLMSDEDLDEVLIRTDLQLQQSINTLENYLQWAQNQQGELTPVFRNDTLFDSV